MIFGATVFLALAASAAVRPSATKTTIAQKRVTGGVQVTVTPRDQFGNFIGPGYASHFNVVINGAKLPGPGDKGDGTYAIKIPYNDEAPVSVTITYDGAPVAKTEIVPLPRKHR
jgi:hypothetical protein